MENKDHLEEIPKKIKDQLTSLEQKIAIWKRLNDEIHKQFDEIKNEIPPLPNSVQHNLQKQLEDIQKPLGIDYEQLLQNLPAVLVITGPDNFFYSNKSPELFEALLQNQLEHSNETYLEEKNGTREWYRRITKEQDGYQLEIYANITDYKQLETSFRYDCKTEALTYSSLTKEYNHLMKQLENKELNNVAFVICDIDDFKEVNDHNGHIIGDEVLKYVVDTIRSYLRPIDLLGRFGGDEFIFCIKDCSLEMASRKTFEINHVLQKHPLKISLSFGIAEMLKGKEIETVHKEADMALYHSKRSGKGQTTIYDRSNSLLLQFKKLKKH